MGQMLTSTDTYSDLYTTLLEVTDIQSKRPGFSNAHEFQAMSYRSSSESVTSSIHALLEAMMGSRWPLCWRKNLRVGLKLSEIHRDGVA